MTKNKEKKATRKDLASAFVCAAIVFAVFKIILMNCIIPTESMEDTIPKKSLIMANRLAYKNKNPKKGDIIIFKNLEEFQYPMVKRVIATEGDIVEIKNREVYVNGVKFDSSFVKGETLPIKQDTYNVPEGSYFVMGDNREESEDSRFWKYPYLKKDQIIAKVIFRYTSRPPFAKRLDAPISEVK